MRKASIVVLAVLLQIAIQAGAAGDEKRIKGPTQSQKTTPTKSAATEPKYLTDSFDANIEKLRVPYFGHDIEQVYDGFSERKKTDRKDEFESTEQYQKRLAGQANKPLFGSVGTDSLLAFVVKPASEYDADTQTLTISIPTEPVWESVRIDSSRLGLNVKDKSDSTKSIGQNAFGAKVEIDELRSTQFLLAIHNQSNFRTEKVADANMKRLMESLPRAPSLPSNFYDNLKKTAFVQRIKMEPEEARAAKEKLSALVLANPVVPYVSNGAILNKATIDNPHEYFAQLYYVDVELKEIWIYSTQSGEILSKIGSGQATQPSSQNSNESCETQDSTQYKEQLKAKGAGALVTESCRILAKMHSYDGRASQRSVSCNKELAKITQARQEEDPDARPVTNGDCFTAQYGVSVGMTPDQVAEIGRLPNRIEERPMNVGGRKTIQWRYEAFSLYFENGVLYAIQLY